MSHSDAPAPAAVGYAELGFIGLGRMGFPMARNLANAGYHLNIYNRDLSKARTLAETATCHVCETPAELASRSEVIFTMVSDGQALREIFNRPDGIISQIKPGSIAVDMSTVGPDTIASLREAINNASAELVDAPVSGSVEFADKATLLVMAGGNRQDVEQVRPYLEALGTVTYVGESGSGARMKLIVNAVIYALIQAVAEALVLAERSGIQRSAAYDVLTRSAVAAPLLSYRRQAFENPGSADAQFALRLAEKDLGLVTELAADVQAPVPQAELIRRILGHAAAAGFAEHDVSAVAEFLRHASADQLRKLDP